MGCSKDEAITNEQEPFSIEENNQPIVNGNKPGLVNAKFGTISFFSTSIKNGDFIKEWTQEAVNPYPNIKLDRKLLRNGTFKGNLSGFGKINSTLNSTYTFISCEPALIDCPPNCGEPMMYKLIADGTIYISTRDYCSITITGNLYPWYYTDIQFDGGLFIGTATTHSGYGKLKNFNKTFWIWRKGMDRRGINLTTGEMSLDIME
ncbi:MAG: hypothetical protein APF83_13130 [Lutibacter sp. BRH_c52]|nr:MAG: hypothetical protein APF83_13130 [Lutibacter sp. BRH_c52]HCE55223.1 hypothetical protein [Lutibacter sp.]